MYVDIYIQRSVLIRSSADGYSSLIYCIVWWMQNA